MNKYPDFWSVLLGAGPHGFFFGYFALGIICMATMVCVLAMTRDRNSNNTPKEWSWKFFWVNNSIRFLVGILLMYVFVRLAYQYLPVSYMLIATIGLGFGFMYLAQLAKNIGLWTTSKASEAIKNAIEKGTDK